MVGKKIGTLFYFESEEFHVEFYRIVEGKTEKIKIEVTKPFGNVGYTDRHSFTVDESRHGLIFKDNPNDEFLYRNVHMIPVIDKNGEPIELSVKFSVCPTGRVTIISIAKHDIGGHVNEILHERVVLHNDFLCDTVTRFIENDIPINWETGVIFKQCLTSCYPLNKTRCNEEDCSKRDR